MNYIHIEFEHPSDLFEMTRRSGVQVFYDEFLVPEHTYLWAISNKPEIFLEILSCQVRNDLKHLLDGRDMMAASYTLDQERKP